VMHQPPLVLVADDEHLIAETLVEILESEGFRALSVSDGAAAVRVARAEEPDVLVCDVVMPILNGVEAAKQISRYLPEVCIILFSGQAAAGDAIDAARDEGHQFVIFAKPVRPELLIAEIRRQLSTRSPVISERQRKAM
jgi:DNA-binding NtrC family response regulator